MYPHPQAALLADPTWYPYQQMMLYQVSPPGYVPTAAHYVGGGSPQLIPGAMYHPYSGIWKSDIVAIYTVFPEIFGKSHRIRN